MPANRLKIAGAGPHAHHIDMTLPLAHADLVACLNDPSALGCAAREAVQVVHTHASTVLLCGDRAWKIKKPVRLGFLDFSTLERRRADCERELELNRRLAPAIYLGLSAVVRRGTGVLMVDAPAPDDIVVEWAVRMRRMPADGMLDRLVPAGGVTPEHMRAFASHLAEFHARAPVEGGAQAHGAVERIADRLRANVARLAQWVPPTSGSVSPPQRPMGAAARADAAETPLEHEFLEALGGAAERWIDRIAPTLRERRALGHVRDGHGDLHTRNLCMIDGQVTAYDCLEFDDALRCADVAADVGFLAMDLSRLGRPDLAHDFVRAYAEFSGDEGIAEPARFFGFHYAVVRAMVESIRLGQPETLPAERPAIVRAIRDFAMLAAGYAVEPATVLMMGLPATGKSTLGRALARHLRATVIESDRVRKEIHGIAPTERGPSGMYSAQATALTYRALAERAEPIRGSVVIDASHHTTPERASSIAAAVRRSGPWILLEVDAERATIESRMRRRAKDPSSVSDATIAVHERLRMQREAPSEVGQEHHLLVDSRDGQAWIDQACQRALRRLMLSAELHGVP